MTEIADPWGSPRYLMLLELCGDAEERHRQYESTGQLPYLETAITLFSEVLDVAVNVDLRGAASNGLGTALWSRYERYVEPADLDRAIDLFRAALAMFPSEETPLTSAFRANLGGALQLRWLRTRSDADLTESLAAIRSVVGVTAPTDDRRSTRVGNLGDALLALFVQHGDSATLDEAIQLFREAVAGARPGTAQFARACSNLGEALRMRHQTVGDRDRAVLDEAVECARAALSATSRTDPLLPRFQSNLAAILLGRFRSRSRPTDLAEATDLIEMAVRATPLSDPHRPQRLSILTAVRRMNLMQVTGLRAIDIRQPSEVLGAVRADRRATRSILSSRRRAQLPRRQRAALNQLTQAAASAAAAVPDGHVLWADALIAYGSALSFKAVVEGDAAARLAAKAAYRQVATNAGAPVRTRVTAGWQWALAELATSSGLDWSAAMEPFELAVRLLPRIAPRRVTHADRERGLAGISGLARDAAACAIQLGAPEQALQLLEHGRGVLLGQALDARTELTDLREQHPDLAGRFEELRSTLDLPADDSIATVATPKFGVALPGLDRHAVAEEWERLIESIRSLPGFGKFLDPLPIDRLLSGVPGSAPIVVINVSGLRCDAILVYDGTVTSVPLPELSQADLVRRVDEFRSAVSQARHRDLPAAVRATAQQVVQQTLAWLAMAVTDPVLRALALPQRSPAAGEPPRVWWIPTGPMSALPLHAAGSHGTAGACVLDAVVSSYAPTLRSLVETVGTSPHPPVPLVVSVPAASGFPELPGVRGETAALVVRVPDCQVLEGRQATRSSVLEALSRHSWVHFASHAVGPADGVVPGYLVLDDHATDPLTVADIARLRLGNVELAYLSACGTSIAPDRLDDEVLHLAGAFRMAGFRHVIGTLWSVTDGVATAVADDFYAAVTAGGVDISRTALALHNAVNRVRSRYPESPELWAPQIHVGP
ncbi:MULTISPECIES: CHAT domain-containing protein [Kribbella]|uniref:CHAT domain-containing protein n=1 Tax=Kribbella karoonensis TaxID=324851 RepID=A0ABP4Q881_9ACTN